MKKTFKFMAQTPFGIDEPKYFVQFKDIIKDKYYTERLRIATMRFAIDYNVDFDMVMVNEI